MTTRRFASAVGFAFAGVLIATACGSDGKASDSVAATSPAATSPAASSPVASSPAGTTPAASTTVAGGAATTVASGGGEIIAGLITKDDKNPFFIKMKEGATAAAKAKGITLLTAAGKSDAGANADQIAAIENMVSAGAKGILITPSNTSAIVPAIQKARDAGVVVIALDTPTDPTEGADALFATDNEAAGELIGKYAKAAIGTTAPKVALLSGNPAETVVVLRRDGFLKGFGIELSDASVICDAPDAGDQGKGQTSMENCLSKDPGINVVFTLNEPTAFGAQKALKAAGATGVIVVSVDGGCQGTQGVKDGDIAATSQQYPLKMASLGVDAIYEFATSGKKPSGYTDTGVTLITDKPQAGVDSKDTTFGLANCWG